MGVVVVCVALVGCVVPVWCVVPVAAGEGAVDGGPDTRADGGGAGAVDGAAVVVRGVGPEVGLEVGMGTVVARVLGPDGTGIVTRGVLCGVLGSVVGDEESGDGRVEEGGAVENVGAVEADDVDADEGPDGPVGGVGRAGLVTVAVARAEAPATSGAGTAGPRVVVAGIVVAGVVAAGVGSLDRDGDALCRGVAPVAGRVAPGFVAPGFVAPVFVAPVFVAPGLADPGLAAVGVPVAALVGSAGTVKVGLMGTLGLAVTGRVTVMPSAVPSTATASGWAESGPGAVGVAPPFDTGAEAPTAGAEVGAVARGVGPASVATADGATSAGGFWACRGFWACCGFWTGGRGAAGADGTGSITMLTGPPEAGSTTIAGPPAVIVDRDGAGGFAGEPAPPGVGGAELVTWGVGDAPGAVGASAGAVTVAGTGREGWGSGAGAGRTGAGGAVVSTGRGPDGAGASTVASAAGFGAVVAGTATVRSGGQGWPCREDLAVVAAGAVVLAGAVVPPGLRGSAADAVPALQTTSAVATGRAAAAERALVWNDAFI